MWPSEENKLQVISAISKGQIKVFYFFLKYFPPIFGVVSVSSYISHIKIIWRF